MHIKFHSQQGLSLIEMMLATAMGLLLLAGISSLSLTSLFSSTDTQRSLILQQDAQAMLSLISRDIRRAGFHPDENSVLEMRKIWLIDTNSSQTCILFRYHNPDFPKQNTHGFKFTAPANGSNKGFVKMLTSAEASSCSDGEWQALNSNRNMLITQFKISPHSAFESTNSGVKEVISNLDIDLEATDNAGKFKIHLNQSVQLRNRPFLQE
jgi:Tfp pilus assembly protein PilW